MVSDANCDAGWTVTHLHFRCLVSLGSNYRAFRAASGSKAPLETPCGGTARFSSWCVADRRSTASICGGQVFRWAGREFRVGRIHSFEGMVVCSGNVEVAPRAWRGDWKL